MVYCHNCGNKNEGHTKHCTECGSNLKIHHSTTSEEKPHTAHHSQNTVIKSGGFFSGLMNGIGGMVGCCIGAIIIIAIIIAIAAS